MNKLVRLFSKKRRQGVPVPSKNNSLFTPEIPPRYVIEERCPEVVETAVCGLDKNSHSADDLLFAEDQLEDKIEKDHQNSQEEFQEQTEHRCLVLLIHGLPADVTQKSVSHFIDVFFVAKCNARFPAVEFLQPRKGKNNNKKSVGVVFENAQDLQEFWEFPHPNPFPESLHKVMKDSDEKERMKVVPPREMNTNPVIENTILYFEKLPRRATEADLVRFIGEEFIKRDHQGRFCLKIFHSWEVSAKVIMVSIEAAKTFCCNRNGKIFEPFGVPIQASTVTHPAPFKVGTHSAPVKVGEHPGPVKKYNSKMVFITGMPKEVDPNDVYKFTDYYCLSFLRERFPPICIYYNYNGVRKTTGMAKLTFENEEDAERYCDFPHYNPFPDHALFLGRYDSNGDRRDVRVEPLNQNKNPKIEGAIVFCEDLPPEVTEEDLINLVEEESIKCDDKGKYCMTIFRGRKRTSAKILMASLEDAESLVEGCDGKIIHPFKAPIRVSIC